MVGADETIKLWRLHAMQCYVMKLNVMQLKLCLTKKQNSTERERFPSSKLHCNAKPRLHLD